MKAKGFRGKRLFHKTDLLNKLFSILTLLFFNVNIAFALPSGQQVVNGNATFNTKGNSLTITNTPNTIINWQNFSIFSNEAVLFSQQNSSSSVLNRITGQNPSYILGLLQSNGRVLLVNPNGIFFGQGARINVNGLIASTLNISNQDFLAGHYNFAAGSTAGPIQNQGTITTPGGGSVYLIAPSIENSGIITSPTGQVLLAAGHSVQLVDSSNPDIAVVVSADGDSAVNLGQIIAQSGKIGIYGGLITQSGMVSADSATLGSNGQIIFKATGDVTLDAGSTTSAKGGGTIQVLGGMESGTVTVNGTLDASAPNGGNGGFIETSASLVNIGSNAYITTAAPYGKTGTWLIDPQDYTINAAGANSIGTALGATNVTITTTSTTATCTGVTCTGAVNGGNGDINVESSISWTAATTLTLSAYNNINVDAAITGTNTSSISGLVLGAGGDITGAGIITLGSSLKATAVTGINLSGLNVVPNVNLTSSGSGHNIIYNSNVGAGNTLSIGGSANGGYFTVAEHSGNIDVTGDSNYNIYNYITTSGGSVNLTAAQSVILDNGININAGSGNVSLTATSGSITGGGVITASSLSSSALTGISLTGINVVPTVSLANSGSGNVSYRSSIGASNTVSVSGNNLGGGNFAVTENSGNINETGITTAGGAVTLTAPGAITLAGNIDTSNSNTAQSAAVTFTSSANAITETTGVITAGTLSANAATGINLSGNNISPDVILQDSTSGNVSYNGGMGSAGTLRVSGYNNGAGNFTVTETSGRISEYGITTAGGAVSLTTTQPGGEIFISGAINAAGGPVTLTASASDIFGGGAITAGSLTSSALTGISLTGMNVVPTVSLKNSGSGDVIYNSTVGSGNTLTLSGYNQGAGNLFAVTENSGNLTVGAGNITTNGGGVTLSAANNSITQSGNITTSGGSVSLSANNNITANGNITTSGGGVSLSAANNITGSGNINAGTGSVELTSTTAGAINDTGTITTSYSLSASAWTGITLSGANAPELTLFAQGGAINVADIAALTDLSVTTNGATTNQKITAPNLTSYSVSETGGNTTINNVSSSGNLNFSYFNIPGYIAVNGPIAAGTGSVFLESGNSYVDETGPGVITADYLQVAAKTGIALNNSNNALSVSLTNFGSGDIIYNSSMGAGNILYFSGKNAGAGNVITVTENSGSIYDQGITTSGGAVNLTTTQPGGAIYIGYPIDTTNSGSNAPAPVALSSADTINGTGIITASTLTSSALTGISLTGMNVVPTVSLTNTGNGDIIYNSGIFEGTLTVSGINHGAGNAFSVSENNGNLGVGAANITASNGPINLYAYQNINVQGAINAGTGGNVALTSADGYISSNVVPVITGNSVALNAYGNIGVDDSINVNTPKLSIITQGSQILVNDNAAPILTDLSVTTSGVAATQTITATSSGLIYNVSDSGGATSITGVSNGSNPLNFSYEDTGSGSGSPGNIILASGGSINTGAGSVTLISDNGFVGSADSSGSITAGSLSVAASGGINLQGNNHVPTVTLNNENNYPSSNYFILYNSAEASGLDVHGSNIAPGAAFIVTENSGSLTVGSPIITNGGPVNLTTAESAGAISIADNIDTTYYSSVASAPVTLNSATSINGNGVITASSLTATAATGITLGEVNASQLSLVAPTTATGGAFSVNDTAALTDLSISSNGTTTSQTITASNLNYSATESGNNTSISSLSSSGNPNFTYHNTCDSAGNITVNGPISAGNVTLISDNGSVTGAAP